MVARLVAGDDAALAAIYDEHSALVHGIAARLLGREAAVDICQEVFVSLWNHPARFDPARGTLRTFLAMITRRRCIDQLRSSGRRVVNEQRSADATTIAPDVEDAALTVLARERVRAAMDALPTEQRRAIELAYFDGLTFRQVAEHTGASEGTAKSRIRLGLQRLAAELRATEEVHQP
jgi:RNA polymerase sigma factor (sigma-70 family)